MASITIKSLPPALHEGLKEAAGANHRSLQGEIIACLERHVEGLPRRRAELLAEAAALRERLPPFRSRLGGGRKARRGAERRLDVLQSGGQDQRVDGGFDEAAGEIEPHSQRRSERGRARRRPPISPAAARIRKKGVSNERSADSRTLFAGGYGQAGEDDDGDRIGHVAADPARRLMVIDGSRRECVIPLYLLASADDEGPGGAGFLVRPGASLDPGIQARHAALKGIDPVPLVKGFRGARGGRAFPAPVTLPTAPESKGVWRVPCSDSAVHREA